MNPSGKAILKAAEYLPPHEAPGEDYPFILITGRTLYHFHTRTNTARAPQLQGAAPDVWVEMSATDASREQISEGDLVEITSPRGVIRAKVRISDIRENVLFVPFHYGYWDRPADESHDRSRAANELTITDWDPASKQPLFKTAAAAVSRISAGDGQPAPAPTNTASGPVDAEVPPTRGGPAAAVSEQLSVPVGGTR